MLPILFDKDTKNSEHPAKKYNAFHDKYTHIWLVYIFIPNAISCGGYIFDPSFSQSVSQPVSQSASPVILPAQLLFDLCIEFLQTLKVRVLWTQILDKQITR